MDLGGRNMSSSGDVCQIHQQWLLYTLWSGLVHNHGADYTCRQFWCIFGEDASPKYGCTQQEVLGTHSAHSCSVCVRVCVLVCLC